MGWLDELREIDHGDEPSVTQDKPVQKPQPAAKRPRAPSRSLLNGPVGRLRTALSTSSTSGSARRRLFVASTLVIVAVAAAGGVLWTVVAQRAEEAAIGVPVSAASPTSEAAAANGSIVIGFYPGWVTYAPDTVDYSPWTHVGHFGVYPRMDGTLEFGDFAARDLGPAVRAAHRAGRKALLVIGSDGHGREFRSATSDRYRPTFVRSIVRTAVEYGYDGIDIDWASPVDDERFAALIADLRAAVDATRSSLILTFDAVSGLLPPELAARVHSNVDHINLMSYWSDGADQIALYTEAGVPAGKLIVGICLHRGDEGGEGSCHGTTTRRVEQTISIASAEGAAGVMVWSFQHLDGGWRDARLEPIRRLAEASAG